MLRICGQTLLTVSFLFLFIGAPALAQSSQPRQLEKKLELTDSDDKKFSISFLSYVPKKKPKNGKKLPLILFLHGAGERGDELGRVKVWGPPKLIEKGKEFPAVVLSPQCPKGVWWNAKQLKALLDHQVKEHKIDPNRIYVTGLSMGGFGTWNLLAAYPDYFAAGIPICGGGTPRRAKEFAHVPVWVFHGDADRVVPVSGSKRMVEALKKAGRKPKVTMFENVGHNRWSPAYEDEKTFQWLLRQVKKKQGTTKK